jgi:uncharacterized integral membrane protein (TIGR00698 family)
MPSQPSAAFRPIAATVTEIAPGIAVSAAVAVAAYFAAPLVARALPIPAMVLALILGMILNPFAAKPATQPGMTFCVKKLLRWAVALLGVRVALADIAALGVATAFLVVASMAATLGAGYVFARWNGQRAEFGALTGAAVAVCGASAALATSTVVPNYPNKQADIVFVVVGVNAFATVAMVLYPPLCTFLGFDPQTSGVMLGGTIHDVAQVVGAGYAASDAVGNAAVIVKLFRVFLLLPVVLVVGWSFTRRGKEHAEARVPLPVFAIVFLMLCLVNSAVPLAPSLVPVYAPVRAVLVDVSTWGLLIAIGALGLGTSISAITVLGWRHVATLTGTTLTILAIVTGGLLAIRSF